MENISAAEPMPDQVFLTAAKFASAIMGIGSSYLLAESVSATDVQTLSATGMAAGAVAVLWYAFKHSYQKRIEELEEQYQARLSDKDNQIQKLEKRLDEKGS